MNIYNKNNRAGALTPAESRSKMRKEVEMLMAELLGMKKVLDPKASTFPMKNREYYQGEIVDSVIERLEELLEDKLK